MQKHFVTNTLLGRFIIIVKSIPANFVGVFFFFCIFFQIPTKLYCEKGIKNFFPLDFYFNHLKIILMEMRKTKRFPRD